MLYNLNKYLYRKLIEVATGNTYISNEDVYHLHLPDYFNSSKNAIVYRTRQVDNYDAFDLNNFLQIYEARINIIGMDLDELNDIQIDTIHTLLAADNETYLDFELRLNTEVFNELLGVWEKVLLVYITTNSNYIIIDNSFNNSFSNAFDI